MDLNLAEGKRRSPRNAIDQLVSLELTGLEQSKVLAVRIDGTCVDISSEGMGMMTKGTLRKGDVLKLNLSINNMQVTLPILAVVKWLLQVDGQNRAGLQFLA